MGRQIKKKKRGLSQWPCQLKHTGIVGLNHTRGTDVCAFPVYFCCPMKVSGIETRLISVTNATRYSHFAFSFTSGFGRVRPKHIACRAIA
jgi:hypothetical protein